jgi:uncharacterized membrane protein
MKKSPFDTPIARWLIPIAGVIVLAGWLYFAPPGILGKADAVGYAVCHRISERSFHIGGRQLPLCARCTGTFTAAFVGLVFQFFVSRKKAGMPPLKITLPLLLFAAAWFVDGSNSYLYLIKTVHPGAFPQIPNLYIPNNTLRLLTGSGMGLGMSAALYPAFNQSVWRNLDMRPALGSWKEFLLLLGIMSIIDAAILTESPLVLYPVAYIGPIGVLMLLTLIYTVFWVMLTRQENAFETWRGLWLPLTAGFTFAMLMILGIDVLRFSATGTWSGFTIG